MALAVWLPAAHSDTDTGTDTGHQAWYAASVSTLAVPVSSITCAQPVLGSGWSRGQGAAWELSRYVQATFPCACCMHSELKRRHSTSCPCYRHDHAHTLPCPPRLVTHVHTDLACGTPVGLVTPRPTAHWLQVPESGTGAPTSVTDWCG